MAFLVNPANLATVPMLESAQAAAHNVHVEILPVEARTASEIENAFSIITRKNAKALIVAVDPFLIQQGRQLAELAVRHRVPTICSQLEYANEGGLISYGQNLAEGYHRAATYVDKIFKGTSPADLPVEQPMKIDMAINLKAAKAIGIAVPQSILLQADVVIE